MSEHTDSELIAWLGRSYGKPSEAQATIDLIKSKTNRIADLLERNQNLETELGASRDLVDYWSEIQNRMRAERDDWRLKAKARQRRLDSQ